jgi:hypothetical protein
MEWARYPSLSPAEPQLLRDSSDRKQQVEALDGEVLDIGLAIGTMGMCTSRYFPSYDLFEIEMLRNIQLRRKSSRSSNLEIHKQPTHRTANPTGSMSSMPHPLTMISGMPGFKTKR